MGERFQPGLGRNPHFGWSSLERGGVRGATSPPLNHEECEYSGGQ